MLERKKIALIQLVARTRRSVANVDAAEPKRPQQRHIPRNRAINGAPTTRFPSRSHRTRRIFATLRDHINPTALRRNRGPDVPIELPYFLRTRQHLIAHPNWNHCQPQHHHAIRPSRAKYTKRNYDRQQDPLHKTRHPIEITTQRLPFLTSSRASTPLSVTKRDGIYHPG
jgi:hypothetical protein